jgi:C_GCAxxG_C_C family probable redox protein
MNYVEKAKENHKKGYNCAQAVFCAFSDVLGLEEEQAYAISEGFGSGMGGTLMTCGALTGAYMVLSMKNSDKTLGSKATRMGTYQLVKELTAQFEGKNGSSLCKEIKGMTGGPVLRSCPGCVEDAATMTAAMLGVE